MGTGRCVATASGGGVVTASGMALGTVMTMGMVTALVLATKPGEGLDMQVTGCGDGMFGRRNGEGFGFGYGYGHPEGYGYGEGYGPGRGYGAGTSTIMARIQPPAAAGARQLDSRPAGPGQ
jgi:hypothetical protein